MESASAASKRIRATLIACIMIFALGQFHRAAGGVFGPILTDRLDAPAALLGLLVGAMFAATLASQAPAGAALDRFGAKPVILWALAFVGVGSALFAAAPSLGDATWPALFASRIISGAGLAATGAGVQIALARNLPPGDYGYASGLLVTLGGVGGLLGTWPLAAALERLSWVVVFGGVAGIVCLATVLVLKILPSEPPASCKPTDEHVSFRSLLRRKDIRRILCLGAVTYAPIVTITGLWGGPYLQDVHGMSPEDAGRALMGLFAATIAAGFVFGRIDRIGRGRNELIVCSAAGSAGCLTLLALIPAPDAWLALTLIGSAVFLQQFYIPLGVRLRDAVPGSALGRANALMMLVAVGAIPVMQAAFGVILDASDAFGAPPDVRYRAAFGAIAATLAIAIIVYLPQRPAGDQTNWQRGA